MQNPEMPNANATQAPLPTANARNCQRRREGNKRDLLIGLGYVAAVGALLSWGGHALCSWKDNLDATPPLNCYNPVWCQDGTHVAFLQTQPDALGGNDDKCSLWTTDSRNDASQLVVKDLENNYKIAGWFDNNSTIILQGLQGEDAHLVLMVVSINTRQLTKYSFNDPTICVLGAGSNEIFMQRKLHNNLSNADEIEFLTWSPTQPQLTKIISIPDRPTVEVNIDSVVPNADASYFAMVLRNTPKGPEDDTKAAPPAPAPGTEETTSIAPTENSTEELSGQQQYSVWVLDRGAKQLTWTNFTVIDPQSVHASWSSDSSLLSCVANYKNYADVALYQQNADLRYARLRTSAMEGELKPQLRSSQPETYLVSTKRIMVYNFDSNTSTVLADASTFKMQPTSIDLAYGSDAFTVSTLLSNSTQLYLGSLNHKNPEHINLAGKVTPPTIMYEVAATLQCASNYWRR